MSFFLLSATLQDAKTSSTARVRNNQTVAVYLPAGGMTLADASTAMNLFLEALDNVTEAKIISASILLSHTLPAGLKAAPVANSDVQEGGLLTYSVTGSPYPYSVRVPAYLASLMVGGQVIPNTTATLALSELLTGLNVGFPNAWSDKYENELIAFLEGKKSFRK